VGARDSPAFNLSLSLHASALAFKSELRNDACAGEDGDAS